MPPGCQSLGEPGKVLRALRKGRIMTHPFVCLTLALGLAAAIPASGQAESNCAERESVVEKLQSSYGETRQSIGLARTIRWSRSLPATRPAPGRSR